MALDPIQLSIIGSLTDSFGYAVLTEAAIIKSRNEKAQSTKSVSDPGQLNVLGNQIVLLGDTILAIAAELEKTEAPARKQAQSSIDAQRITGSQSGSSNNALIESEADFYNVLGAWIGVISDIISLKAAELAKQAE